MSMRPDRRCRMRKMLLSLTSKDFADYRGASHRASPNQTRHAETHPSINDPKPPTPPRLPASTSSERRCGRPCSLAKFKAPVGSGSRAVAKNHFRKAHCEATFSGSFMKEVSA